ncbi:UDP-N-acetylglucosamine 2-epimerase (non-hydrolyzing) [Sphingomonas daechungensis]|uniref:UDP-N-acetylglucosamine 2-epimerase (non-hydrolyzing) n=1 Tax=Sphingomonas daechungensis TaxID=1176646 RepID=A0ABX6T3I8_9SPHN|nr:UDP-N-acetylglucosamine 2-epimerase (non-hydrolyzing) [Sphingomonas daechungensis]
MYDSRVALVVGTRPEAIKLAPLAKALIERGIASRLILTGQHPNLRASEYGMPDLPTVGLSCAGLPDPNAHAGTVARSIGQALDGIRLVIVQGDTSSAVGGGLGAAQTGVPVAHVEAGLRSHDRRDPWPEEDFRIAIDAMATLLFAPTVLNAANLRRERVRGRISLTGNTGIDVLLDRIRGLRPATTDPCRKRLLVTCHRRESWEALPAIASSLIALARRSDVAIALVLHPNQRVAGEMVRLLGRTPNLDLRPPCGHVEILQLMRDSDLILSDSGGIQEEAPALGIPLLVLRDRTERPEGISSGNAVLVGRDPERIYATASALLDSTDVLASMSTPNLPYGDGAASKRIAQAIEDWLATEPCPNVRSSEPRSPSLLSVTAQVAQ